MVIKELLGGKMSDWIYSPPTPEDLPTEEEWANTKFPAKHLQRIIDYLYHGGNTPIQNHRSEDPSGMKIDVDYKMITAMNVVLKRRRFRFRVRALKTGPDLVCLKLETAPRTPV